MTWAQSRVEAHHAKEQAAEAWERCKAAEAGQDLLRELLAQSWERREALETELAETNKKLYACQRKLLAQSRGKRNPLEAADE